jgi:hypothetical protein
MDPKIETFPDFVAFAQRLQPTPPAVRGYAFRGHADAGWKLTSKLLRLIEERLGLTTNPSPWEHEFAYHIETEITKAFRERAHLNVDSNTLLTTDNLSQMLDTWALMQHFGSPTRLLDWSWSAYVALYFAVIDHFDKDGAVWYMNRALYDQEMVNLRDDGHIALLPSDPQEIYNWFYVGTRPYSPLPIFWEQERPAERMVAQQGFFSFSRDVSANLSVELPKLFGPDRSMFGQVIIPKEHKNSFLRELRSMNITADSLFPGLEGLGRSMNEFARLVG